jgi:hypothetical protein
VYNIKEKILIAHLINCKKYFMEEGNLKLFNGAMTFCCMAFSRMEHYGLLSFQQICGS